MRLAEILRRTIEKHSAVILHALKTKQKTFSPQSALTSNRVLCCVFELESFVALLQSPIKTQQTFIVSIMFEIKMNVFMTLIFTFQ